jgi:hypothetical protein
MRGNGYPTLKGRQVQISLYLPPKQYWSLRAATTKTGLSIQALLRRALEQVVNDVRRASFADSASSNAAGKVKRKAPAAGDGQRHADRQVAQK